MLNFFQISTFALSAKSMMNLLSLKSCACTECRYVLSFTEELNSKISDLITHQGKSERIKNFPYPRQFATLGYTFINLFIMMLPFGIIPEFHKLGTSLIESFPNIGGYFVWLAIPFSSIVSWVFNTMQRIGTVGENPFEGSANDVPISTISRGIEIDLLEMIDTPKEEIPGPVPTDFDVQM